MIRPELQKLVDRSMADPNFLQRLLSNPETTAREAGVELTPEEVAQIRPLNPDQAREMIQTGRAGC